jgi:CRP/FNR family transcriptional regulator
MSNHLDLLKTVPLFANLPPDALERIDTLAVERGYPAGADVVTQGERAVGFFVVVDGSVAVVREPGATQIATLKAGDFFGEMALLDGQLRSASVRAAEPTTCLVLPRWDFLSEVRHNPELAIALLQLLSQRIRRLEERLDQ